MYSSIVVGTDGSSRSRQAVAAAAELSRVHGASLHLVRAYRSAMASLPGVGLAGDAMVALAPSTDDEIEEQVKRQLDELAGEIRATGVKVDTYPCCDAAPSAILSVAAHQDADLVVVGSKGMHGARRVLGSVPNTIAHQAPCAVLIVPTDT